MTRIGSVRRLILSRQGERPWAGAWALLAVAAPFLLRLAIEPWVTDVPFLTFFPSLLVATVVLGWRWGVAVLITSAMVANYAFQPPVMSFALSAQDMISAAGFLLCGALIVSGAEALRRAMFELEERSHRESGLNLELQHRVNNNLAVIQALAQQSARHAQTPEAFYATFSERLLAVSEANKVLARGSWEVSLLPELAEAALRPFYSRGTIDLDGVRCELPAKSSVPLVLALHELATNATKYGALSNSDGCVRVTWRVEGDRCRIRWTEEGGPPVEPPTRRGLGARLLRRQPGLDQVSVDYAPDGVVCEIVIEGAAACA
ncbi:sensor histidine kinase [Phenylobacterium sp.]|jgi:two-component sensor histidine kinase|uniref:sensor histidine kinase n=1 Tax=Phenylobacterium sp. TaxID=1871053 RepID=UPI003782FF40